ncbi:MAG: lysophospholipid acyltransferase family protein [Rikenellaceae bacterium]|nr:lysophospholipid acyltransferase family protein [Rikenellaceae bacterium]
MSKINELNFIQRIELELLWAFSWCFSIMPYWFKFYLVAPLLSFVLCYLLRYRRGVIMENLENSFPEKSQEELETIAKKYYRNLAEVFVGTVNMAHMPLKKIRRYVHTPNFLEESQHFAGSDVVVAFAHYSLWELGAFWDHLRPEWVSIGVYKPLHSVVMDCYYERLRTTPYSYPVPKREIMRFYLRNREKGWEGRKLAIGLIADQNAHLRPDSHWYRFLNQDTLFYDGPEQLALRYHLPIAYVTIDRLKPGVYTILVDMLYDGKSPAEKHELTERYVRRVEQMIQARPELWMWSHRRWKHKREEQEVREA